MSITWDGDFFYSKKFNQQIEKINEKLQERENEKNNFNIRIGCFAFVAIVLVFAHPFVFLFFGSLFVGFSIYAYKSNLKNIDEKINNLLDEKLSMEDNKSLWYNRRFTNKESLKTYQEAIIIEKNNFFKHDLTVLNYIKNRNKEL